jgi:hypothetical protein
MLVLIPSSGFVGDLRVDSLTQPLDITQTHGEASISISRDSPAWSAAGINDQGGFIVQIATPTGPWRGIADRPTYRAEGLTMKVYGLTQWLAIRPLPSDRTFFGASAAVVFRWAILQAIAGLAHIPLIVGTVVETPPLLNVYAVSAGQSLLQVLNDLVTFCGLEWSLEDVPAAAIKLHLRTREQRYRDRVYVDTGRLFSDYQGTSLQDQYREIEEVQPSGQRLLVRANEVSPFWPSRQIVQVGS